MKKKFFDIYNNLHKPYEDDFIPGHKELYNMKSLEAYFGNMENVAITRLNNYLICCRADLPPVQINICNLS